MKRFNTRRLRKKYHQAEFAPVVFEVFFRLDPAPNNTDWDLIFDRFIEFVEAHNFACFGVSCNPKFRLTIMQIRWRRKGGRLIAVSRGLKATETDRQKFQIWLEEKYPDLGFSSKIVEFNIGPLTPLE